MFRSSTILRELVQSLTKVTLLFKHPVKLRRCILCGDVAACREMACVLFVVQTAVCTTNSTHRFWGPPSLLFLPRLQRLGRAADHSPIVLSLRMAGAIPPLTYCVRGLKRDIFSISFTLFHFTSILNSLYNLMTIKQLI